MNTQSYTKTNTIKAPRDYITFADSYETWDKENLVASAIVDKEVQGTKFRFFLIQYRYPQGVGSLYVSEHEETTTGGIITKVINGNAVHKITIKLDVNNELDAKLIQIYKDVDNFCFRTGVVQFNGLESPSDETMKAVTSDWRSSIFEGDQSGQYILYRDVYNCSWNDRVTGENKTSRAEFKIPNGKGGGEDLVEWEEIMSKSFSFYPIIQFYRFFYGACKSVKVSITQGLISSEIKTYASTVTQTAALNKIMSNTDLMSKLEADTKRLALKKNKLSMMVNNIKGSQSSAYDDVPKGDMESSSDDSIEN